MQNLRFKIRSWQEFLSAFKTIEQNWQPRRSVIAGLAIAGPIFRRYDLSVSVSRPALSHAVGSCRLWSRVRFDSRRKSLGDSFYHARCHHRACIFRAHRNRWSYNPIP